MTEKTLSPASGKLKMDSNSPAEHVTQNHEKKLSKVERFVHLWEKKEVEELLEGIYVAAVQDEADLTPLISEEQDAQEAAIQDIRICDKMFCATCGVEFQEREDQIEHFKSDWHRFNLKKKLKAQLVVSESQFEEITNKGDLSSISGSECSSEDESPKESIKQNQRSKVEEDPEDEGQYHIEGIGKRHPRVFLKNHTGELLSVYRCVIHSKKNAPSSTESLVAMIKDVPRETKWGLFMLAGGHFAGAVFNGNEVVEHKTFHRYVIRAKGGTVQSVHDNKGSKARSFGASARRYHEAALTQDIKDLIASWSDHVKACHRIFLRMPTHNKAVFYGGKVPLFDKKDPRIRLVPFPTRRPTFKELHRVHNILSSFECYGTESKLEDHIILSPKKSVAPLPDADLVTGVQALAAVPNELPDIVKYLDSLEEVNGGSVSTDNKSDSLVFEYVSIDTSELDPFEISKRPKKKKSKKEKKLDESDEVLPIELIEEPEIVALKNDLYTSCRTKDTDKLINMLETLALSEEKCDVIPDIQDLDSCSPSLDPQGAALDPQDTDIEAVSADADSGLNKSKFKEILNGPFGNHGNTLLHVAAEVGHKEVLSVLMKAGSDPCIKNGQGRLPYSLACNKNTRNEFRRFMAKYPDMYDYHKAQVPSPLSDELEKEKKIKEVEKRNHHKKVKKEKMREQKEQEEKNRKEAEERQKFLALSDREKRALAAEKRLTAQKQDTEHCAASPVLRCFQCASDMTGKVPFEYHMYNFCTTKCLQKHRQQSTKTHS